MHRLYIIYNNNTLIAIVIINMSHLMKKQQPCYDIFSSELTIIDTKWLNFFPIPPSYISLGFANNLICPQHRWVDGLLKYLSLETYFCLLGLILEANMVSVAQSRPHHLHLMQSEYSQRTV